MQHIKNIIKRLYKNLPIYWHIKQPHLKSDILMVHIVQKPARLLEVGQKVIIKDRGHANIVALREITTYPKRTAVILHLRDKEKVEKKFSDVNQYFAVWIDIIGRKREVPLKFDHYDFIDPTVEKTLAEVTISRKHYAVLTEQYRKHNSYITCFNSVKGGPVVLQKLRADGTIINPPKSDNKILLIKKR